MSWFVNPIMLAGGAAVASPIILHFFFKARFRRLPWAAIKFLKEAIEQTSRRVKFQEWILLLLRCLLIILLALALARPKRDASEPARAGDAIDAIFLIDTSYSMGAPDGTMETEVDGKKVPKPVTRLQRAQHAARTILDGLPANSSVQILEWAGPGKPIDRGPTYRFDRDDARRIIDQLRPTGLTNDLETGMAGALDALRRVQTENRAAEVYIFTDLQKLTFRKQKELRARCEEVRKLARIVFVRCCDPKSELQNLALVDVRQLGVIAQARTRTQFIVTLKNTGSVPVAGVKVGLTVSDLATKDGSPPGPGDADPSLGQELTQVGEIKPGQSLEVPIPIQLPKAGPQLLTVRMSGDGLPGDNRFDRVLLVRDTIRALVVDGTPNPTTPTRSGAHAVAVGLNPTQSSELLVQPTVITVDTANRELGKAMENKDLVVLCNVPVEGPTGWPAPKDGQPPVVPLSRKFIDELAEFVRRGGGLLIGLGDRAESLYQPRDARQQPTGPPLLAYNHHLGSGGVGLLPYDLVADAQGKAEPKEPQSPFRLSPGTTADPSFLKAFRNVPYAPALAEVTATKRFRLRMKDDGGRVLIRMADGGAFVASRSFGEGEVVLVTTGMDLRPPDSGNEPPWSNFAARPKAFVPFLQLVAAALSARKVEVPAEPRTAGLAIDWQPKSTDTRFVLAKPLNADPAGPRRVDLERLPRYQITDKVLTDLRKTDVPAEVLRKLEPIKGTIYETREQLERTLTETFTEKEQQDFTKRVVEQARENPPLGRVETTDTAESGVYRIFVSGSPQAGGPIFPMNPDLRESEELGPASPADLKDWLGFEPAIIQAGGKVQAELNELRRRDELTLAFLLALLVLLLVESVWAWGCSGTANVDLGRVLCWLGQVLGVAIAVFGGISLVQRLVYDQSEVGQLWSWLLLALGLLMFVGCWVTGMFLKRGVPAAPAATGTASAAA